MLRSLAIAATAVLLALPLAAQQQDEPSAPAPQQNQPAQNNGQKKDSQQKKSTAEANPFPEAQSEAAAHAGQQQDAPSAPAPQATPQHKSEADQNPFPESQSERAAKQTQDNSAPDQQQEPGAPESSSSQIHLKGLDLNGTTDSPKPPVMSPDLASRDTKVGIFYLQTGDPKGAYDRFLEATRVDPGNADAVYGLAEAARRLNRRDEAVRNYQLYLAALPHGPKAKDARRALKDLGAHPGS